MSGAAEVSTVMCTPTDCVAGGIAAGCVAGGLGVLGAPAAAARRAAVKTARMIKAIEFRSSMLNSRGKKAARRAGRAAWRGAHRLRAASNALARAAHQP